METQVDRARGVLVTAQGLLMYLKPAQVHRLIAALALPATTTAPPGHRPDPRDQGPGPACLRRVAEAGP